MDFSPVRYCPVSDETARWSGGPAYVQDPSHVGGGAIAGGGCLFQDREQGAAGVGLPGCDG